MHDRYGIVGGKLAAADGATERLLAMCMNSIASILSRTWRAAASLSAPAPQPSAAPLHVLDQDARLRLDDGLLVVEREQRKPVRLRLPDVLSVSLHGRATLTTPAVQALLAEGIPIIWRSASGHYLGQTVDLYRQTARVRRAQYAAQDTPLALDLARRLVGGKIANMRALLRRRVRDSQRVASATGTLTASMERVPHASDLDVLRGVEGAASAAYFACWPDLLKGPAAEMEFPGRQRRPPVGPVNALLSYYYAVIAGNCSVAAVAAGLDPAEGFLHAARAGRPALALDLMEPFRPAIADSAVLFALNTGEVSVSDFESANGGTRLTDAGQRKALTVLERRMEDCFLLETGLRTPYRAAIDRLAQSVAHSLIDGTPDRLLMPERS